jgi:signal transduction histidine kinase
MNIKGTGLGLSICKQLIEQMGGNIAVHSKVGVGSKFIIELEMEALDQITSNVFIDS